MSLLAAAYPLQPFASHQPQFFSPVTKQPSGKENIPRKCDPVLVLSHKYKTELCKNWEEHGYCTYGTKCRFAHGVQELNCKERLNGKYKSRPCQAFFSTMFCPYGGRCLFKHDERRVDEISKMYYTTLNKCPEVWNKVPKRRLPVFMNILNQDEGVLNETYKVQEKNIEKMLSEYEM